MDQYLIDLLLDQVLRGNKIGHAFITQAWNEIVKSFNSKFGSHYDKEVLKSRYKHLRQQYSDVKILLDQSGFSWDENQEMVTAEEYVWDSFTKAYPDAQSYKFRTVPSYQKLCVIYGEEVPNGRPSCTAHNQDLKSKDPDSDYSKTDWTLPMDRYLIDLLLNQVRIGHKYKRLKKLYNDIKHLLKLGEFYWDESRQMVMGPDDVWDAYIKIRRGNMVDQNFNEQAWSDMVVKFVVEFGSQHDKYGLKSRFEGMRNLFLDMRALIDQNGFAWDEMQQMITASGDIWDDYIKFKRMTNPLLVVNSDTLSIAWTKPMDRYFIDLMLGQVLEGNKVLFCMMTSLNEKFELQFDKCVLENRYLSLMDQYNNVNTFLYQNGFTWNEMQQKLTADDLVWEAYIEHSDAKVYKDIILKNYEMGMDGVFGALRSLTRDIEVSNVRKRPRSTIATHGRKLQKTSDELQEAGRSNTAEKNCISIERIVDALQAVPDMDDELSLDACYLLEEMKKAKAFVKMDIPH
ncbi:hypothetical protein Acr_08g0000360 [Actinidia rufa]|uniref:Myb/SANT-like domain-containing protein n=1 Tax=Actinidia rufa TaxID=165716 RepID=A0A7J0EYZ2_9ERIC|nr:hypothetical protein Acr_08g0000360 [Actinidia rufa]